MKLDEELMTEIERLAQTYSDFRDSHIDNEGLEQVNRWNIDKIIKMCESEKYDSKPYITYYYEEKMKWRGQDYDRIGEEIREALNDISTRNT